MNNATFNPLSRTLKVKKPRGLFRGKKQAGYNVYNALTGVLLATFTSGVFQVPVGINEIYVAAVTDRGVGNKVYMKLAA